MWSEEFDNKFRGLHGSHNEPPFEEAAWDKMEKVLDIHLPREKKKRRGIIFWFTLAGLGLLIPALILLTGNRHQQPVPGVNPVPGKAIASQNNPAQPAPGRSTPSENDPAAAHTSSTRDAVKNDVREITANPSPITIADKTGSIDNPYSGIAHTTPASLKKNSRKPLAAKKEAAQKRSATAKPVSENMPDVQGGPGSGNDKTLQPTETGLTTTPDENLVNNAVGRTEVKNLVSDSMQSGDSILAQKKSTGVNPSPFAITVSFGPDISSVGLNNAGTTKIQFGAGLSYDLGKRFTLRTGLYAARKVYDADSADYHPPAHFWNYYSNLQRVNANCLVFEIPVTVAYRFKPSPKNSWFAAAGISSVIMKEETYGYSYKNSSGQPAYYTSRYKNENSHLFSVINLSGGYQANLSKRFSLAAEPYFKLPIAGIGYGKIRLNSYGLLLTASYHPFTKKEKR